MGREEGSSADSHLDRSICPPSAYDMPMGFSPWGVFDCYLNETGERGDLDSGRYIGLSHLVAKGFWPPYPKVSLSLQDCDQLSSIDIGKWVILVGLPFSRWESLVESKRRCRVHHSFRLDP